MDQGEVRLIRAEMARLDKMPVLAKQIAEFQPQPDPHIEEMKMLEREKLKSEIEERKSRSRENAVDIHAKAAKAALDEAKTRQINSDADGKDLDFTRKADGTEFEEKMQEKNFDRETQKQLKQPQFD